MKRRDFIKTAAAALAVATIIPSRVFGANAPSKTLTMACIGVGRMGRGDMKEVLRAGGDGVRIIAVCDTDRNRAQKAAQEVDKHYGTKDQVSVFQDFRDLLALKDIDGVTISTPDHQHACVAVAAAKAGKDIYLQKPLTYSIVEGRRLVEAVRKNKVILQVGSQQRSSQYFRITCELVRNGRIGKLQGIEVGLPDDKGTGNAAVVPVPVNLDFKQWLGPALDAPYAEDRVHPQKNYDRPGWLQIEQYCRGMITGWGAHMFDIAQWGLGTDIDSGPVEVEAKGEFPDRGLFDVHTTFKGEALYANGLKMTSANGPAGVKFIGTNGWIWVDRGGFKAHDRDIFRQEISEKETRLYRSKDHMADFLNAMRTRKDPICPVEVGHRTNSVCIIHHIAMKLGRKLKWNPVDERFTGDDEANKLLDYQHRTGWEV